MTCAPGEPNGSSRWSFMLAAAATATAICMSVLAGWQRGGELPERFVWVAIGVVLVISAHLLPALCRSAPLLMRGVGSLLWVTCMATACVGHTTFFVLAQQHAGERRASSFVPVVADTVTAGRTLTAVMTERASVIRQLAIADAQRCSRNCTTLQVRHLTLTPRLDALNAEADDVRRRQAADDRAIARRDALAVDPVTARLAALLGTAAARVDLFSGLACAAVLEGVACLLWCVTLQPRHRAVATPVAIDPVAPVASGHEPVMPGHASVGATIPETDTEVTKLAKDIAAGHVRATVADIRRYLGCSQARAIALRRRLAASS